ncbi:metallophosphoesterase [Rufibacter immobilis]|uniref:metallophosphoesterase n=1 Tax=Rufibacter immobilis TaxID=1348778 RepID=UPI0035F0D501
MLVKNPKKAALKQPKKFAQLLKKTVKWGALAIVAYGVLTTLFLGQSFMDEKSGVYRFHWSGVDALFNGEEFGFARNKAVPTQLDGADGPYIFGEQQFYVSSQNELKKAAFIPKQPVTVRVANPDRDSFQVFIKKPYLPGPDTYPLPDRLLAISDIEGNFDAFYSFLISNGVMDQRYHWTFGRGHLVLNGDMVDRGNNETQVLWLIYHLEAEATQHGGKVHYILGNHEIMKLYGDHSYADYKYHEVAKQISGASRWDSAAQFLYSPASELGQWLRAKNIAERIGPYLFVHAGLTPKHAQARLQLADLNQIARNHYGTPYQKGTGSSKEKLVLSSYDSPYWDRSLSLGLLYKTVFLLNDPLNANLHKTTQQELEQTLAFYGASKIVIGHSVVEDVTPDYEGKVIKIDVKHGTGKKTGRTKGLLVRQRQEFKTDDLGEPVLL